MATITPLHPQRSSAPLLEVDGVSLEYRTPQRVVRATHQVGFEVHAAERFVLLGASGCGKSTLLKAIAGFIAPVEGEIRLDGRPVRGPGPDRLVVFQEFDQLPPWKTVRDNVAFPLLASRTLGRREAHERALHWLEKVGLARFADSYPHQLSGGMKQRVAIARALAGRPTVLLCDEATSALDQASTTGVLELLRRVRSELGLTVLLITHEMAVVKAVCDSAVLLERGRVVDSGRLSEVLTREHSPLSDALLPAPLADAGAGHDGVLLRVTVTDRTPETVVLQTLIGQLGLAVEVAGGSVETVAGGRYGRLLLRATGDLSRLDGALRGLRDDGVLIEAVPRDTGAVAATGAGR
jgi:D-methionine transport system ATP-binding protein